MYLLGFRRILFIVRPHAKNFDVVCWLDDFIHQSVLHIDTPGVRFIQTSPQFFVGWWRLIRINLEDIQQLNGLGLKPRVSQFLGVFVCLRRVNQVPG